MASVNSGSGLLAFALVVGLAGAPLGCSDETPGAPTAAAADASAGEVGASSKSGDGGAIDGAVSGAVDGAADGPLAAPPPIECFKDTPRTHEELLNACWPDTVTAVRKTVTLPGGYTAGTPLPPPPR